VTQLQPALDEQLGLLIVQRVEVIPNLRVEHTWPCYGVMDCLALDNGLEFHGSALEGAAMDLQALVQGGTRTFCFTVLTSSKSANW